MTWTIATISELKNANTCSPSARKLRGEHASLLSVLAEHQGGRARTWLERHAGLLGLALGWPAAFAGALAPMPADDATKLIVFSAACVGFGVAWMAKGEERGSTGRRAESDSLTDAQLRERINRCRARILEGLGCEVPASIREGSGHADKR